MTAGTTSALLVRARDARAWALTADLFLDHDKRLTIDYYNEYGANKVGQWADKRRPEQCSVTNLGAFGNFLRALIGVEAAHNGIAIRPAIPPGLKRLNVKVPLRFGDSLVYLDLQPGKRCEGELAGKALPRIAGGVLAPADLLGREAHIVIRTPM